VWREDFVFLVLYLGEKYVYRRGFGPGNGKNRATRLAPHNPHYDFIRVELFEHDHVIPPRWKEAL